MVIVSELDVGRSAEQHVGSCMAGHAMVSAIAVGLPILLCLSKLVTGVALVGLRDVDIEGFFESLIAVFIYSLA